MTTAAGSKPSVLVVDDEEVIACLLEEVLVQSGFNVQTALSGEQGYKHFAENKEDWSCIIIDMTMPDMLGTELYRRMCDLRKGVPVIFVSGYNSEPSTLKSAENTTVRFLQKPFTPFELAKEVSAIVEQSSKTSSPESSG